MIKWETSPSLPNEEALRMSLVHAGFGLNHAELLKSVFDMETCDIALDSDKKRLKDDQSIAVFTIIWKNSDYISDDDLMNAGMTRNDVDLNVNRISVMLEKDTAKLDSTRAFVAKVIRSAKEAGLVEEEKINSTRHVIKGTKLLHDFMCKLAYQNKCMIETI